ERGGHVRRGGGLRVAEGGGRGLHRAAPVRPAARAAAGHRGEGAGDEADLGARRDVRHLPAAQADHAGARPRRAELRLLVVRGARRGPLRGRQYPPLRPPRRLTPPPSPPTPSRRIPYPPPTHPHPPPPAAPPPP